MGEENILFIVTFIFAVTDGITANGVGSSVVAGVHLCFLAIYRIRPPGVCGVLVNNTYAAYFILQCYLLLIFSRFNCEKF